MRSETDDRNARETIGPVLKEAGFEVISLRGIDQGDYWIHLKREAKDPMRDEHMGKVSQ